MEVTEKDKYITDKITDKKRVNSIYRVLAAMWDRFKAEPVPFLFFGFVMGSKIYFLIDFLVLKGNLTYIGRLVEQAGQGGGIPEVLSNLIGHLAYNLIAILFDALIITSYFIRSKPVSKAEGFWERYYPLITILFPMIGFSLLLIPEFRLFFPSLHIGQVMMYFDLPLLFPLIIELAGLIISFIGASLSIVTLWSLRRSFSIMAEVRHLVTTGMYRRIRHPLYMSEMLHAFGTAILASHSVALVIFLIAFTMEMIRAKIEERKFLRLIPEYAEYKKRTGFLWPKF
ncbi:MAG: methyltransferase family protein [bacterium]